MANKPKFLKNLLTTASALSLLAAGAGEALGVDTVSIRAAGAARLSTPADWQQAAANVAPAAGAANNVFFGVAQDMEFDAAVGNLGTLNLYGFNGQTVTVTQANKLVNVINTFDATTIAAVTAANNNAARVNGGAANATVAFDINFAGTMEFGAGNAGDLSALGAITLSDAAAVAKFSAANQTIQAINGGAAGKGVVEINSTGLVFNGGIGNATAVSSVTLANNTSATIKTGLKIDDANGAAAVTIGQGAELIIDDAVNITGVNGGGNTAKILGAGAGQGALTFAGGSTVVMPDGIGQGGNHLNLIKLKGDNTKTVNATAVANIKATTLNFEGDSQLTFNGDLEAAVTTATDGKGQLTLNGADGKIIGAVGADGKALRKLHVATNHKLEIAANSPIYAKEFTTATNNQGKISFVDGHELFSDIGTAAAKFAVVQIDNVAAKTLKVNTAIYATTLDLATKAANNILELNDGAKIDATYVGSTAGATVIQVAGNAEFVGSIAKGAAPSPLAAKNNVDTILFNTADKTLTVGGAGVELGGANGINFAKNGTLKLTHNAGHVTVAAPVVVAADGNGTIDANAIGAGKNLTINGQIGDVVAGKALGRLSVAGNVRVVELKGGSAYIKDLDISGNELNQLKLSNAGEYKITNLIHADGDGILTTGANITLKEGTVVSKPDSKLNKVDIALGDLTLENGVDIYAKDGIDGGSNLKLTGDHTIDAVIGKNTAVHDIEITAGAAGKISKFVKDVNVNLANSIKLMDANAAVQFAGNVTGKVTANAANQGTVEFINSGDATITGTIGAGNAVNLVKFSGTGGNLTITGAVVSNTGLAFSDGSSGKVTFDTADIQAMDITVAGTDKTNSIVIKDDHIFTGNIGASGKELGSIIMDNNVAKTVTVKTDKFFSAIDFVHDKTHNVVINKAGAEITSIGTKDATAKTVDIRENVTVKSGTWAQDITITQKTATLGGMISAKADDGTIQLTGNVANVAKLVVMDGATLNSAVTGNDTNNEIVTFAGNATVNAAIDKVGLVEFVGNSGKTIQLGANITAQQVTLRKDEFSLTKDVTVKGPVTSQDSTITLGKLDDQGALVEGHNLTLTGGAINLTSPTIKIPAGQKLTIDGSAAKLNGKLVLKASFVDGSIVLTNAASLDLSSLTAVELEFDDSVTPENGQTITMLTGSAAANVTDVANLSMFTFNNERFNGFAHYEYKGKSEVQYVDTATEGYKTLITNANSPFIDPGLAAALGNPNNTADMKEFTDTVKELRSAGAADQAVNATERLVTVEEATGAIEQAQTAVTGMIGSRLETVAAPSRFELTQGAGVAAGDEATRYGVWGSPFYSQGTQKRNGTAPGYKAQATGLTVGFDTLANDTMTIGAAVSFIRNTIKYKGKQFSGDKTNINTYMISVYGSQQVTDNWFVQGIASFGSSNVKNKALRVTGLNKKGTATGKYDSMSYSIEALAGYNIKVADTAIFTPMGGLRYSKFNDAGYKETGNTNQNRMVSKKATDKIEAILGARATFAVTEVNGIIINPEIHAFVNHDFKGKAAKISAKLNGTVADSANNAAAKPDRTRFNIGLGLNAQYSMMDYGLGYDAELSKKRTDHVGTLKVRINF